MSTTSSLRAVLPLAVALVGCGGRYGGTPPDHPRAPASAGDPAGGAAAAPAGGIEAAALPYQIVDVRTGKSVDEAAFWARLGAARAVCIGEEHPNPHDHWVQLHVVRELTSRLPKGTALALAMEMFQRPFQGVLDDYAAHKIDAATLRSRSGYADRWGYDYGFYGPTIDAAVGGGAQLLAANAAKELTKKVSHQGLDKLTAEERAQLPELRLDVAAHRAWFDALMESMGGSAAHGRREDSSGAAAEPAAKPADKDKAADKAKAPPAKAHGDGAAEMPSAERIYTVQVIWDETMADTGARWLVAHPGGHLVVLAGNGHCHDSAIVGRLKRRGVTDAISVRGVIDDGEGSVADVLAKPIHDYALVLQMPPGVQKADGERAE